MFLVDVRASLMFREESFAISYLSLARWFSGGTSQNYGRWTKLNIPIKLLPASSRPCSVELFHFSRTVAAIYR